MFDGQGHVEHFYGNYSEYAEQVQQEKSATPKVKQVQKNHSPKKEKTKLSYHEQKEWETIEDEIEALEIKIETLKTQIAAEGSNIEVVQELFKEQQTLENELDIKMERWEELSLLVESFMK